MAKTIGQVAYEKWIELINNRLSGLFEPAWDRLPESAKAGWEEIALAAVNHQNDIDMAELTKSLDAQMGESDG